VLNSELSGEFIGLISLKHFDILLLTSAYIDCDSEKLSLSHIRRAFFPLDLLVSLFILPLRRGILLVELC
jgi:hypothetical protein